MKFKLTNDQVIKREIVKLVGAHTFSKVKVLDWSVDTNWWLRFECIVDGERRHGSCNWNSLLEVVV